MAKALLPGHDLSGYHPPATQEALDLLPVGREAFDQVAWLTGSCWHEPRSSTLDHHLLVRPGRADVHAVRTTFEVAGHTHLANEEPG